MRIPHAINRHRDRLKPKKTDGRFSPRGLGRFIGKLIIAVLVMWFLIQYL